jgi:glycosyltransferase involved in cell wall biosynthesis
MIGRVDDAHRRARLLYLIAEDWYFVSHRLPLAKAAMAAGFDVYLATRLSKHADMFAAEGFRVLPIDMHRSSTNPLAEMRVIAQLVRIYRQVSPDIVHHVAVKPVVYGSLAARIARVPSIVNALAGLGYVFSSRSAKARSLLPAVCFALRHLFRKDGHALILQNPDDCELFVSKALIARNQIRVIRGSGVDLDSFAPADEPPAPSLVVLPARMLKDKGVVEFVEAARALRSQGFRARFALVGQPDSDNPASIDVEQLQAWQAEGAIEWWGWRDDMAAVYSQASLVCLPSYREGLPKALLEAAACGKPIVATDVPGCREVVKHGQNGLLVKPRDATTLTWALKELLESAEARARMGVEGRRLVERDFSEGAVIAATLDLYRELLAADGR